MENPLENLQNACRACMKGGVKMQCLFKIEVDSTPISEMFSFLCTVNISPDDGLPNSICLNCLNLLVTTHDFQQMCLQSDLEMRAMLNNFPNNQREESNTIPEIATESESEDNTIKTNDQKPSVDGINSEMAEYLIADRQITENISERVKDEQNSDNDFDNFTSQILEDVSNDFCDEQIAEYSIIDDQMMENISEGNSDHDLDIVNNETKIPGDVSNDEKIVNSKLEALTSHIKTHEVKRHECNLCTRTFSTNSQLIHHMNRHNSKKSLSCHVCQKSFLLSSTLNDHLRVHSGEKPYLCAECGKSFTRRTGLQAHLLRHSAVKRFSCPECPSKFPMKAKLESHMITHTGIKPHACDVCGSSFTEAQSLRKHKRLHTGIENKPYPCEVCGKRFISSYYVKNHMRSHTGEKPFKCEFCDSSYTQSGALLRHTRINHNEKPYQCSECPEKFRLQKELRVHNQIHYKDKQMKNE